jgi:hypothetical protein
MKNKTLIIVTMGIIFIALGCTRVNEEKPIKKVNYEEATDLISKTKYFEKRKDDVKNTVVLIPRSDSGENELVLDLYENLLSFYRSLY